MAGLSSRRLNRRVRLGKQLNPGIFAATLLKCTACAEYIPTSNQVKLRNRVTRSLGRSSVSFVIQM